MMTQLKVASIVVGEYMTLNNCMQDMHLYMCVAVVAVVEVACEICEPKTNAFLF